MRSLPSRIMSYASESPEGTLVCPSALLHLGSRAAVDQALSRLSRKGELMRVCVSGRGRMGGKTGRVQPISTCFEK